MRRTFVIHHFACFTLAVAVALSPVSQAQPAPNENAHSLCMPTGAPPAAGYQSYADALNTRGQVVIPNVPGYEWRHGCGPTAVGMVLGYYDGLNCAALIPGSAVTQTTAVNMAIANGMHYNDYSLPIDDDETGLQPDASYYGGAHESNCLADFMETSWYASSNIYGWSRLNKVDNSMRDYVDLINAQHGLSYSCSSWDETWGMFTWDDFTDEINAGRPMVFLVDTDGDDATDHFITAIGYRDTSGYPEYACLDTWAPGANIRWARFREKAAGIPWGIHAATYFVLDSGCGAVVTLQPTPTQNLCAGADVELRVETNAVTPQYQWRKGQTGLVDDGVHVVGAATDSLLIQNIAADDADADYHCVIYDASRDCSVYSQSAEIIVDDSTPVFTMQPVDVIADEGGWATFFVGVQDSVFYNFQWRKDGVELVDDARIFGSASGTLVVTALELTDAGAYDCLVAAQLGLQCSLASESAVLTVNPAQNDCPEDLNDDEAVNLQDLATLLGSYGLTGATPEQGDFDGDGDVDLSDLARLLGVYGQSCPTR